MHFLININLHKWTLFLFMTVCETSCSNKVEQTKPQTEDITESVYASGVIKSREQYEVFATVNGLIQEIMVKEGDTVHKGEALIKVVNETPRLNTENARLSADFTNINANNEKLDELRANIDFARIKLANDSLLLVRQQNLWRENIGSRNELEQRELAYKNASTNYQAATLKLVQLEKQLSFDASQSKNNLQISHIIAGDYVVRSEVDGRVYGLLKEKGEMVTPQSPVAVIGDANNFMLELQVDEYDIVKIRPGQKVLLHLDSYKGQVFEAVVEKIDPMMNERTRSFTVEAGFTKRPPTLYPSLTAEANIVTQTKEKALIIPRGYLVDGSFVLVNKNEKKAVTIGLKDYEKVEIVKGITASQIIYKPGK